MTADQFATEGGEGMSQSNTLPYYQYMGNPILHAQQNSISYLLNLSINITVVNMCTYISNCHG